MKMLDALDLQLNELRNFVVQVLSADPANTEARLYYNSTSHTLRYYNGTSWLDLAAATYTDEQAQDAIAAAFAAGTNTVVTVTYNDASNSFSLTIGTGQVTATMIATGTITDTQVAAANKDGVAGTASLRTLGTGAQQAMAGNTRLDTIAAPTGSVALNSQKITGLADPTSAQDGATKAYVDATAAGIDWKASVRAASTANLTLSGAQTIDGVSVIAGDRVLVKDQSTGANNGIYVVAAGAWARATDADTSAEMTSGVAVFVEEGTVNGDTGWTLTTNNPITLGTTALVFTQFTSLGQITAGAGLTKTGSTIDAQVDGTTVEIASDTIRIAATAAGAGLTGGGASALAVGAGTGISVAADAVAIDTTVVPRFFKGALTGGATSEVVTHNLGTRDVIVQVINNASPWDAVMVTWEATSTNTVTIRGGANLPASYRVVVMG